MSGDSAPGTAARVLLIQISDIHFFEPTDAVLKRSAEIAAAVQPLLPLATRVVLIVTGDIAQSGKSTEYDLATSSSTASPPTSKVAMVGRQKSSPYLATMTRISNHHERGFARTF